MTNWAEDYIMDMQQGDEPLEQYVEDFLSMLDQVRCSDSMINACFQMGLKDYRLFQILTPGVCHKSIADFLNYILDLSGSKFLVDVENSHSPPIRKHVLATSHHQPDSSACLSNESGPFIQILSSKSSVISPLSNSAVTSWPPGLYLMPWPPGPAMAFRTTCPAIAS
ncbi:hypothetical protein QQF64_013506 [Cirrhinus molitorella]|uniref:Retrotransposon gag domain-containing protein n=1 Tax=Cirrhinus molitorella TaxID=172907 RepID=A0ABR3LT04_9TELE